MADVIKVKPKKNYEWNQDPKYINVRIPVPANSSIKKLEIYLSDLILRVTSTEKKTTYSLDLAKEIDYLSPDNKFVVSGGELHATLRKRNPQQWNQLLVQDISLAQLKVRRRQSEARHEANIKQVEQNKQKIRGDYDRKATQELMKFQDQQRQKLQAKKSADKQAALNEVFSNVNNDSGKFNKQSRPHNNNKLVTEIRNLNEEEKWKQKELIALQMIEKEQQEERNRTQQRQRQNRTIESYQKSYAKQKSKTLNTMFSEQEVQKFDQMRENAGEADYEEIPVRKEASVKMKFTEKVYPHMAARDFHYTEPPLPKNLQKKQNAGGDLQQRNPLWLKDKADRLFKDKNYISSLQAYTEAIRLDQKFINAYKNRTLCWMKLFNPVQAIKDCDTIMSLMQNEIVSGQQHQSQARVDILKTKVRKAICLAWKGSLKEAKQLLVQLSKDFDQQTPADIKSQIQESLKTIEQRERSIRQKLRGDRQVNISNSKAIQSYSHALKIDRNQYAISNKCLCLNRQNKFQECIELADEGIKKLTEFGVTSANMNKNTGTLSGMAITLLLKLYFRKAKAQQGLIQLKQAEETLRKGLALDPEDKHFQNALKQIVKKQRKGKLQTMRSSATQLLKAQKFRQALNKYSECLKLIESSEDVMDQLAIMQNQSLCYLNLQQNDSLISVCVRGLKIIENHKRRVISIDGKKIQQTEKEKMEDFTKRFLVRRAYAYLQTEQKHNAKSDLQKALELDPKNDKIRKDYEALKLTLGQ